jgi:hypothetical protein
MRAFPGECRHWASWVRSDLAAGEIGCIVELYRDDVALSEVTQCPVGDQAVLEAGRNKVEMGDVSTAPATAASYY